MNKYIFHIFLSSTYFSVNMWRNPKIFLENFSKIVSIFNSYVSTHFWYPVICLKDSSCGNCHLDFHKKFIWWFSCMFFKQSSERRLTYIRQSAVEFCWKLPKGIIYHIIYNCLYPAVYFPVVILNFTCPAFPFFLWNIY